MKRKLALIVAAVMLFSIYTPIRVQAASNNYLTDTLTVAGNTAIVEDKLLEAVTILNTTKSGLEASYFVDGTNLVIELQNQASEDYQFKLELTNASWFFRANAFASDYTSVSDQITEFNALLANKPSLRNEIGLPGDGLIKVGTEILNANKDFVSDNNITDMTYNKLLGYYKPHYTADNGYANTFGNYYRFPHNYQPNPNSLDTWIHELPYKLEISPNDSSLATITLLGSSEIGVPGYRIVIPLVTKTVDENVDISVSIISGNASTISNNRFVFATTSKANTNTTVKDIVVSRDVFEPDSIVITELRPATLHNGWFTISLPEYYEFEEIGNIKIGIEPGLKWANSNTHEGIKIGTPHYSDYDYSVRYHQYSIYEQDKLVTPDPLVNYNRTDNSKLDIYLNGLVPSTEIFGKLYISGIKFFATDEAPVPEAGKTIDIKFTIGDFDPDNFHTGVTTQTGILLAQRVDWAVMLSTTGDIPTLVSGRYIGASRSGADAGDVHKTAHVVLKESTSNAWWASRLTVLSMPATDNSQLKGAKFRKVKITKAEGFEGYITDSLAEETKSYVTSFPETKEAPILADYVTKGVYLNDGEKHGLVTISGNKISFANLQIASGKKGLIEMDLWVSVELGFGEQTGDLVLSIDPSSTSIVGQGSSYPSTVIAHVVDPIQISTKATDLKIGYQYQQTADIQIKELGAGYLIANKKVRVEVTDLMNADFDLAGDIRVSVTDGDLKIKDVLLGSSGFTSQSHSNLPNSGSGSAFEFTIDRASTVASTILISNVGVKVDRTIPLTNYASYNVVVYGTAVAENYGLVDNSSRPWPGGFNTAGKALPYINVVSPANDQTGILTQEVSVPIGESYYVVNGNAYSYDGAAYISSYSNSTMIPLRALSNAFGLDNESQILWDDANKTATIFAPTRTIQFTLNKPNMTINGASITMLSPDGLLVVPEIKNDRMYIPFRHLGIAFGVTVDWEADTQTAIFNKGANSAGVVNSATPTPVPSYGPATA
ncbi:MAG: copper amine oxidase N-terminal domain-containing protein [Clostridiales bacterium]|jgi:hypothetical protein|nr:copper amine oxidase N-terminal domain-containing protein [Clostridiales bacterium]